MNIRKLTIGFWILAIALFAVQAWASRFNMSWDGIQYLDDADLYLKGDWQNAVNSQWSPGYVWVIAAFFRVLQPSSYWEFPVVHLVNFLLALFTLAAFQFFLVGMLRRFTGTLRWAVVAIGYAAFLYATLDFTNLETVTPDLLMHIFVYLVAGFLVRIQAGRQGAMWLLGLGCILGTGYIAKAPFFIYSFVCFGLLAVMLGLRGKAVRGVALAVLGFLLIGGPYIAFLSHFKHRLTYGDSGRYNIVWMVNGVPYYHWHGNPPGSGTPVHPTRQISTDPSAYEFATPIAGTYPPWFDPIYWNEGAKPHYKIGEFVRVAIRELRYYEYLVHHRQLALACGLLILLLVIPDRFQLLRRLVVNWPVLLLGLFPFVMYGLLHVDPRFLSSFFVLLWVTLFVALIEGMPDSSAHVVRAVALVVTGVMLVESAIVSIPSPPIESIQNPVRVTSLQHPYWQMAQALSHMGIQPGDPVAIVGRQLPYFWARLARVHIVSEVLLDDPPCGRTGMEARTADWNRVKDKLAATGAKVIVSPCIHGVVEQPGWQELGETGVFAYRF